jgi:hypothetical protein
MSSLEFYPGTVYGRTVLLWRESSRKWLKFPSAGSCLTQSRATLRQAAIPSHCRGKVMQHRLNRSVRDPYHEQQVQCWYSELYKHGNCINRFHHDFFSFLAFLFYVIFPILFLFPSSCPSYSPSLLNLVFHFLRLVFLLSILFSLSLSSPISAAFPLS